MALPAPKTASTPSTLSGWGRSPVVAGEERRSENLEALTRDAALSRGLGRSYGDASLPDSGSAVVAGTPLADRLLAFDEGSGALRAEAGLTLRELNRLLLPRRWFTPVSPGTQFLTLGGMVAADVHGKNHHRDGTLGAHLLGLRMRVADGRVIECSPEREPELFWATVGGMGLTGHILEVELRMTKLPSPWIWMESERMKDIDCFIAGLKEAGPRWPFTMGWIDCLSRGKSLGRGILMRGRWAEPGEAPSELPRPKRRLSIPFLLPGWVVNRGSVRAFNGLFYGAHLSRVKRGIAHPESFFYPLDVVGHWNRLYGARGFTQYQCVLPESAGPGAARRFLEVLTRRRGAAMLCVIKDCGDQGRGLLSFPKPGISIAMDIPVRGDTQALVDALNEQVIAEGGRIYLAKDAFTRPQHFRAMEPRLAEWKRIRARWDPQGRIRSALSARLLGDGP